MLVITYWILGFASVGVWRGALGYHHGDVSCIHLQRSLYYAVGFDIRFILSYFTNIAVIPSLVLIMQSPVTERSGSDGGAA
jgi:hypothetical protein